MKQSDILKAAWPYIAKLLVDCTNEKWVQDEVFWRYCHLIEDTAHNEAMNEELRPDLYPERK